MSPAFSWRDNLHQLKQIRELDQQCMLSSNIRNGFDLAFRLFDLRVKTFLHTPAAQLHAASFRTIRALRPHYQFLFLCFPFVDHLRHHC